MYVIFSFSQVGCVEARVVRSSNNWDSIQVLICFIQIETPIVILMCTWENHNELSILKLITPTMTLNDLSGSGGVHSKFHLIKSSIGKYFDQANWRPDQTVRTPDQMVNFAIFFSLVVCSMLLAVIAVILTPVWLSITERDSQLLTTSCCKSWNF